MRKKKYALTMIVMLTILFLTGCGSVATKVTIDTMNEISQGIKNESNYSVPNGYSISYPDKSTNSKIAVSTGDTTFIYDMTGENVVLINIEYDCFFNIFISVVITFVITIILCALLSTLDD